MIIPPSFESDEDFLTKNIVVEWMLFNCALEIDKTDPEYFKEIVLLYKRRCHGVDELIYWIAPMITDSPRIWEYARRRLIDLGRIKDA